jgi:DNA-binding MarR family transcriptional regulator
MSEDTSQDNTTQDIDDVRQLAAERLTYVAVLQMQQRRREAAPDTPWRDTQQGQGRVLALLKMKPEITQKELTFLMGMSRQALAELLTKLERQGLIEREASTDDRRVVVVRLTKKGRDAEQDLDGAAFAGDGVLNCLDDAEVVTFCDFLGRVIERLEAGLDGDPVERRQALYDMLRGAPEPPHGRVPGFPPPPPDPRLVDGRDPRLVDGRDPRDPRNRGPRPPFGPHPLPPVPPFDPRFEG